MGIKISKFNKLNKLVTRRQIHNIIPAQSQAAKNHQQNRKVNAERSLFVLGVFSRFICYACYVQS